MQWNKIILIIIIFFAFFLRTWHLESVPDGVYCDEASVGYDAYSILNTGKDFHGHSWPLFFESFGEWKSPMAIYSTVPSIALFGLNPFATRFPSAIFGVLAVIALFFVARELFNEKVALLASAFLAISPWSLMYSRTALEAYSALPALFLFAFWFFLKGLRNSKFLIISAIFFAISLYGYFSSRIFIPLFLMSLLWIFRSDLAANKKQLIMPLAVFIIISLPLIYTGLFTPGILTARAQVVSIIFTPGHSLSEFWGNYGQYFSSDFLFNKGDSNLRHSLPGYGQLLWFMAPLVLAGIAYAIKIYKGDKMHRALFSWFLIFPVGAALTWEGIPHATRSIAGLGLFEIFAALGVFFLFDIFRKNGGRKMAAAIIIIFLFFAVSNVKDFMDDYFLKYPAQSTAWFESGLPETFEFIKQEQDSYDYIVLTPSLDQARTYAAFYLNIDPRIVQNDNYGKIAMCEVPQCNLNGRLLLLRRSGEISYGKILKTFKDVSGNNAFKVEELQHQ